MGIVMFPFHLALGLPDYCLLNLYAARLVDHDDWAAYSVKT